MFAPGFAEAGPTHQQNLQVPSLSLRGALRLKLGLVNINPSEILERESGCIAARMGILSWHHFLDTLHLPHESRSLRLADYNVAVLMQIKIHMHNTTHTHTHILTNKSRHPGIQAYMHPGIPASRHPGVQWHPGGSRRFSAQKLIPLSTKMQHFY